MEGSMSGGAGTSGSATSVSKNMPQPGTRRLRRNPNRTQNAPAPQGEQERRAEAARLLELIAAQAQLVRRVKTEEGEGEKWRKVAVMDEIFKLMELKYRYGRLVAPTKVTAPELWVETEPPHEIKIRWAVRQPRGKIVRLQRPFYDVTHVTGEQVIEAISTHTHRANHFPSLNGFLKIEFKEITKEEDKEIVSWRSILPQDRFCLELRFPGPVLEQEHTFSFRVTWPERTSHLTTPEAYSHCAVLPELVDTGLNLFSKPFAGDVQGVVERAFAAGVSQCVLISTGVENSRWSMNVCATRPRALYAMVGVHPYRATKTPDTALEELRIMARQPNCVAIGECGLDLPRAEKEFKKSVAASEASASSSSASESSIPTKHDSNTRAWTSIDEVLEVQEKWLRLQLELALEVGKPLFFHERGCHDRFLRIIVPYKDRIAGRALVNCFTGTAAELQAYLDMGFTIALTGFLCNTARGVPLREVVAAIPLDRLVIGSDAPHLIPFTMPKPYPRDNEPAFLPHVLVTVAECIGHPLTEIAAVTTANARRFFGLPSLPFDGTLRSVPVLASPNARMAFAQVTAVRPEQPATPAKKPLGHVLGDKDVGGEKGKEKEVEEKKVDAEVRGGKDETKGKERKKKRKDSRRAEIFEHAGRRYGCTAKEKAILSSQKAALSADAFGKLLADFDLKQL